MIRVTKDGQVSEHPIEQAANLPYEDETCDVIEVRESLERFVGEAATQAVARWTAKLREGAELRVSVPDFDRAVDAYKSGTSHEIEPIVCGRKAKGNGPLE
jgi:predicted SAM-dependent methyltransferase